MARTALDLSPQERKLYDPLGAVQRREAAERDQLARLSQLATQVARKAAHILKRDFGAVEVILFGSLVEPSHFTRWSDIDLAAWGIPPDKYYEAVAMVTGLSDIFRIDLVDPATCRPGLLEVIQHEGISL